ncbi:thymidine phosphorylase [Aliiroseovarius sp. YM-037]|uniref:thymidine phosphorylase n=1 Tax=Aliiroseovarius sp. YM-037 TaxID=3341728 RepID=UPI003A7FF798
MDARAIIAQLRDGGSLSADELTWVARGLASGEVTDAQAGAFAMAVLLNGIGNDGRVALTEAMRDSGDVLSWDLPGPVIDKHSTGGVGDCTSLILAPALAACGAYVPMISGRGLGHTGGTLDKLEAIPGVQTEVSEDRFRQIVADVGCAIVSASADVAPADKRLYAIRDITGTVESIDLITASILSKKLAAGLEGLVLDVKTGSGAFMESLEAAEKLAQALVTTANGAGCPTTALVTDMSQPLAPSAGNAVEVADCMKALSGDVDTPLAELTCALGGELLAAGRLATDAEAGGGAIRATLTDGRAMERFDQMIAALGGPTAISEVWQDVLPKAAVTVDVPAQSGGQIAAIDTKALGLAVVHLGGGRLKGGDVIDPSVGLSNIARIGAQVDEGVPLAQIYAANDDQANAAAKAVSAAFSFADDPEIPPLIYKRVSA